MTDKLYDVIAVRLDDKSERIIAERKTEANAEAIVEMAVIRRGCEVEYFTTRPHKEATR